MRLGPETVVGTLARHHPEVEEILGWYGVNLISAEVSLTLEELCEVHQLDLEDVLVDVQAVLDEDEEAEGEDEWDEGDEEDDESSWRPGYDDVEEDEDWDD